jgi:hypothetical protein
MLGLAERVAESGDVLNVAECLEVEKGCGGNIKSLLAMPIRNRHYQIIGKCFGTQAARYFYYSGLEALRFSKACIRQKVKQHSG